MEKEKAKEKEIEKKTEKKVEEVKPVIPYVKNLREVIPTLNVLIKVLTEAINQEKK